MSVDIECDEPHLRLVCIRYVHSTPWPELLRVRALRAIRRIRGNLRKSQSFDALEIVS